MNVERRKRIMVFGGAFDPPHEGHEALANYIFAHDLADEVWFTPCGDSHAFGKKMSPKEHRAAMTKLVVDGLNEELGTEKFKLCTIEVDKEGMSVTYETLGQIARDDPELEIGFLMGEDQLEKFEEWGNWKKMIEEYKKRIFVYPRGKDRRHLLKEGMVYLEGAPKVERESTRIRKEAMAGEVEVRGVRTTVKEYMNNHYHEMYGKTN